jgi:hypothetical protein
MAKIGRRSFLKGGGAVAGWAGLGRGPGRALATAPAGSEAGPRFKLGLVTYEIAKDWDIETIIKNCEAAGFEGVELRTTHRHGVEPSIPKERRAEVRKRFEDSRVRLVSLGSTCEYESPDPSVVERNIQETRRFAELAHDLGCLGVKVRPNGFPKSVPHEKTLVQIGQALSKCGDIARDQGVEIWLEVHGPETELPANFHRIMEVCNHPAVGACWNSNDNDVVDGSVKQNFNLLKAWLKSCHINELWRTESPWHSLESLQGLKGSEGFPEWQKAYPWRELFGLFKSVGYDRYTFAEIPASPDPLRLMRYYRALWEYLAG